MKIWLLKLKNGNNRILTMKTMHFSKRKKKRKNYLVDC